MIRGMNVTSERVGVHQLAPEDEAQGSVRDCSCGWRGVPAVPRSTKYGPDDGRVQCPREVAERTDAKFAETLEALRRTLAARVSRNDPCPCGSGRKAKKCHAA
jgi:hypothetical protein